MGDTKRNTDLYIQQLILDTIDRGDADLRARWIAVLLWLSPVWPLDFASKLRSYAIRYAPDTMPTQSKADHFDARAAGS
jgi:hypothetical protein